MDGVEVGFAGVGVRDGIFFSGCSVSGFDVREVSDSGNSGRGSVGGGGDGGGVAGSWEGVRGGVGGR